MRRALLVAWAIGNLMASAQEWQQLPDFPGTARDDAAAFTIDGIIYVGTGMEVGWGLTNNWYAFDTQSGAWGTIAPLPATPRQYCSGFTLQGKGYLFGGIDASGALNELWCYDPALDEWTEKAPLPAEGRYACVSTGDGGAGHVATGMLGSGVPTNEHWIYTESVDNWFWSQPVPGPARHRAAFFSNTALVIAGGADANGNALSDVWQYDIIFPTGVWVAGPDLPGPRIDAKGISGWNMILCGASDGSNFHDDAWMLINGAWEVLPSFTGGGRRGAAGGGAIGASGGVYLGTGLSGDLERHRDWWLLQPQTGVSEIEDDAFGILPNPASTELRVQFNGKNRIAFRILDSLGQIVLFGQVSSNEAIDISSLTAGQFVMQLIDSNVAHGRFIKLP